MSEQRTVLTPNQYYSRGRIVPTLAANTPSSGLTTVTYSRGSLDFFSYARGAPMDPATILPTDNSYSPLKANSSDTNLVGAAAQTTGGDHVEIEGLSLQVVPRCFVAKAVGLVMAESSAAFYYDGDLLGLLIGPGYFIPGKSTLYGLQQDITVPTSNSGDQPMFGFISNGAPSIHNFLRIPERLHWNSAGQVDSNMVVRFSLHRDVSFVLPVARGAQAGSSSFVGIPAWAQPTQNDLIVDLMVLLHSVQTNRRSGNR